MLTDNVSLRRSYLCRVSSLRAGRRARCDGPRVRPDTFQTPSGSADRSLRRSVSRVIGTCIGTATKTIFDDERFADNLTCGHVFMIEELLREISLWLLIRSRATRRSQHLNVLEAPRASRGAQRLKCEGCDPNRLGAHSVCGRRTCTSAHANSASLLVAHSQAGI